ncbi:hypothetical protein ABD91_21050 [Lysinibacillus sphaericus]|uniref:hypothetical protein n=1 Tax=Lysinibacillus sphaericus TaxID=1421 RepID=UPI0018CE80B9|nr:hypothetical protein [Lysinibacillus sphaericus]MBG9693229.1 hypothetical protein [Lysinibacillus sphaericus]
MDKQEIEGVYKHIIQDVLLPNKNIHLINLEEYSENGVYAVTDKGYQLRVYIESTYDLANLMKPVFAAIQLISALNTGEKVYRQLNDHELAFVMKMQSIEQVLIQDGWLLKENYYDEEGILKAMYGGRIEELQTKQKTMPAIVDKSFFEKVLFVSSKKASSIVLYDTYEGKKLPVGIGFIVIDNTGEELFVIFSFHTFNGLFNYLSSIIHIASPSNLNAQHAEIAVAQELLRVNEFLKKAGIIEEK